MRRKRSMAFRMFGVVSLVLVASLGGVAALTGLSPAGLLGLVAPSRAAVRPVAWPAKAVPARPPVPTYSDGWLADSGMAIAADFEGPITDPTSLAQVGAERAGRAARGIATFEQELARLGRPRS